MGIFKITQLPPAANIKYDEKLLVVQDGDAKQTSLSSVLSVLETAINNVADGAQTAIINVKNSAGLSVYNLSTEVKDNFVKTTINNALSTKVNTIANDYLTSTDKNTIIGNAGLSCYNAQTNLSNEVKNNFVKTSVNNALSTKVNTIADDYLKTADKNAIIGNAGLSVYNVQTNLSNEVKNNFVKTTVNNALSTLVAGISSDYLKSADKNTIIGNAGLSVYNAQTNLSNEVKNNFVKTTINNALSTKVNTIANDYLKSADKNTIIGNAGLSVYNLSSSLSGQVVKDANAFKLGIKTCLSSFATMAPDPDGDFDCDLNTVVSAMINLYKFANA